MLIFVLQAVTGAKCIVIFAIIVNQAPNKRAGGETALRFCRQAIRDGHRISVLLFYADGVYQAVGSFASEPGDLNLADEWLRFSEESGIKLSICSAAAERRLHQDQPLPHGYQSVGLAVAMDRLLGADRVITFGSLVS